MPQSSATIRIFLVLLLGVSLSPVGRGQDAATPQPITTESIRIPIEELKLLVKPLTAEELAVEADAWFKLVRAKTREIVAAQLGVRKTNEALDSAPENAEAAAEAVRDAAEIVEEAEAQAAQEQAEAGADMEEVGAAESAPAVTPPVAAQEAQDAAGAAKGQLLDSLTERRNEQVALIDRLEVVLDSWERKGGDTESYRQYIRAIGGVDLDVSDTTAAWSAIRGWVLSEEGGQRWAWNLIQFVASVVVTWFVARVSGGAVRKVVSATSRGRVSNLAQDALARTVKAGVWIVGFVLALSILEVDITPMLAAIGAAGLVVGLALQGTLSNVASGVMILLNRPFDVGDVVTAGGVSGTISEMSLVATIFRTFDNQTVIVPNNNIWGQVITNVTANKTRRVDLTFGVGYGDDLAKVETIIREVVTTHERVLKDPAPVICVNELGDSSVNFICRPWVNTEDYWTVYWDLTRSVKDRFDAEGISIPFPQRDVHVHYVNGSEKE